MSEPNRQLEIQCARLLHERARAAGPRQQVRAAARRFVRRHRRDPNYLTWVLRSASASSALAVALLGLGTSPSGAELAPIAVAFQATSGAVPVQNSVPALGDLDGDGDLDLVSGEVNGGFLYFQNTGSAVSLGQIFVSAGSPLAGQDVGSFSAPALGDLDADGDLDLVSGELSGTFIYFENTGSATSATFTSSGSNLLSGQDVGSYSTPALGDLDSDGDLDLVAGGAGGFFYFENTGTATSPAFAPRTGAANPFAVAGYIPGGTPSLGDLDGDGDPDFVAGENFGTFFTFENTGIATSPIFAARTGAANPLNGVDIGSTSSPALGDLDGDGDPDLVAGRSSGSLTWLRNFADEFFLHFGSASPLAGPDVGDNAAPALGDLDGDGDLDLVVGKADGNFHYFENTDGATNPAFIRRTGFANPLSDEDVGYHSAPTLGDLDGDGDLDLVAGEQYPIFNYFENTGSATIPVFARRTGGANPFVGQETENYFSKPALGDLDGDGDLDLVAGPADATGRFHYFENTGSGTSPAFVRRTGSANPLDSHDLTPVPRLAPALGDLDGDGDLDLVSSHGYGFFAFFENTGSATSPAFARRSGALDPLNGAYVGYDVAPTLGDIDGDSDLDLVLGEGRGTFSFYESFVRQSPEPAAELIGAANPLDGQDVGSRAAPTLADLDRDGDLDLVAGEDLGTLLFFENTGTAIDAVFVARTGAANPLNGRDVGDRAQPAFGDLDGDGDFDLLVGRLGGDFAYFANTGDAETPLFAAAVANPFGLGSGVGGDSAPTFGDLDADGDLDLVVGQSAGLFSYFLNDGSRTSPIFVVPPNPLDGRDVGTSSTPALGDFDGNGALDLVAGEQSGLFFYFDNGGSAGAADFGPLAGAANPLDGKDVGSNSAPAASDLDGDGDLDLVTGNAAGTFSVHYFPEPARGLLLGAGVALLGWLERRRRQ